MNARELNQLERVFLAEINGLPCYQGRSKLLPILEERGYLDQVSLNLGGRPPVIVRGWWLTHMGRIAYCETCREP